jgi:NAD(P)-dependent dehydrogenase (short-subunit alcohol dehydrogenase family)
MTFDDSVCVVTGASSGIGRALALELGRRGARVWALGRDRDRLADVVSASPAGRVSALAADLGDEEAIRHAAGEVLADGRGVDVLAHCAGAIARGPVEAASVSDLDALYDVTIRGPFVLTRELLPGLRETAGRVVFINSLVRTDDTSDAVLYAAMKQAARTFADGLRIEVAADDIRVVTVAIGRTDTPMQEWVHEYEERDYNPELLLRPDDVVEVVISALAAGPRGEVTDLSFRPVVKFGAKRP